MPRPKLFADEAEVVLVRDLRPGDFLVEFAPQRGIAGAKVNSGITDLVPTWDAWAERNGYRQRRTPVEAMRMRTLSGLDLCLPSAHRVTVRRKLTQAAR